MPITYYENGKKIEFETVEQLLEYEEKVPKIQKVPQEMNNNSTVMTHDKNKKTNGSRWTARQVIGVKLLYSMSDTKEKAIELKKFCKDHNKTKQSVYDMRLKTKDLSNVEIKKRFPKGVE